MSVSGSEVGFAAAELPPGRELGWAHLHWPILSAGIPR